MKPSLILNQYRNQIRAVVRQHHSVNPRVFGSILHGDDTEDSDLDLLVETTADTSLMDIASIQKKLQSLLGIPVDVLTEKALPISFRERVLKEAQPV